MPVVTFHHFTTPLLADRPRRVGGARRAGALRPVRRAVDGAPRRPDRLGLHHQRAERRRRHGVLPRRIPARGQGRLRPLRRRQRGDGAGPPPGRGRLTVRPGRLPGRAHTVHGRDHGHRGRGVPPDAAEEMLENVFLRATGGDDFVGVQCYTRMHFGPDGLAPNDPAVPMTQMGDERWPQAVEHTVRRAAEVSGRPVVVTENGIATDDDAERIAFVSDALRSAHRCLARGHRPAGLFRLEPARQLRVAPRLRPEVRAGGGGTGHLRAPAQAQRALVRRGGAEQPAVTHSGSLPPDRGANWAPG